jgi:RNA polymerase sigma-70 factor (ECF subfamily)
LLSDPELWTQVCHGEAEAFDCLYRRHAPRLQAFLQHIVGDRATAEDVMQETFTQIWRKPNGFRPDRGSLRAYLYGIARKVAVDWWRAQRTEELKPESDYVRCRTEVCSEINDALRRLPVEQRTLLWLREVEGLSYAELAQLLGIPLGTVRSRLFAAREALRGIWHARAEKEDA